MKERMKKLAACALAAALALSGTAALADEGALTIEQLTKEHGSMVSTTETAVTTEQRDAIIKAALSVTLGSSGMWYLTVVPELDLIQELLPTYNEAGLIHEGNVAFIVSCTSEEGAYQQYHVEDVTRYISAGMAAQQICVAAQMQGLGFKVITDSIYESSYTLYRNNEPGEENIVHEGMDWDEWRQMFAIPKDDYYIMSDSGEPITVMNGNTVQLKSKQYQYFEQDGSPAIKYKMNYINGYMTPCVIVLVGNTEEAPKLAKNAEKDFVTIWDGSFDPYPVYYGGSGSKE